MYRRFQCIADKNRATTEITDVRPPEGAALAGRPLKHTAWRHSRYQRNGRRTDWAAFDDEPAVSEPAAPTRESALAAIAARLAWTRRAAVQLRRTAPEQKPQVRRVA